jgi:hypothetical protein
MDHKCSKILSCVFIGIGVVVGEEVINGDGVILGDIVGIIGVNVGFGVIVEKRKDDGLLTI